MMVDYKLLLDIALMVLLLLAGWLFQIILNAFGHMNKRYDKLAKNLKDFQLDVAENYCRREERRIIDCGHEQDRRILTANDIDRMNEL
jgi:23S rRNA C2498 (ribose-2'-O)-methylase RlmM